LRTCGRRWRSECCCARPTCVLPACLRACVWACLLLLAAPVCARASAAAVGVVVQARPRASAHGPMSPLALGLARMEGRMQHSVHACMRAHHEHTQGGGRPSPAAAPPSRPCQVPHPLPLPLLQHADGAVQGAAPGAGADEQVCSRVHKAACRTPTAAARDRQGPVSTHTSAQLCCARAHRFIMGSNKMLQVALGKSESDELRTNLSVIASRLKGHVGLFFTKLPREEVGAGAQGGLPGVVAHGTFGWPRANFGPTTTLVCCALHPPTLAPPTHRWCARSRRLG